MPFNGSGQFSYPNNSVNPAVGGTVIESSAFNAYTSDGETAFSTCLLKDGQQNPTANLPMAGFKHTGVNTNSGSTSRTEYASGATLQDGAPLDAGYTGGTNTAYTATLTPAITAYADKQCFRVLLNATTGVTPTINFNGVGAKKMFFNIGGSPAQVTTGDLLQNQILVLRYDATLDTAAGGFWVVNQPYPLNVPALTETTTVDAYTDFIPLYDASASASRKVRPEYLLGLMRGHIWGLTLSNNASDATNDIDIAAGQAVDNADFALMVLASGLTKQLDAAWAVGTNQGMLDTGSIANTTYFIFLIQRADTGVVDVLASTSPTAPTMPANYDHFRRIGAIIRSGGAIVAFRQSGNRFLLGSIQNGFSQSNPGTSAVTQAISGLPVGLVVEAILSVTVTDISPAGVAGNFLMSALTQTDVAPSASINDLKYLGVGTQYTNSTEAQIPTDTSAQIRTRCDKSDADISFNGTVHGWVDTRGQFDTP